MRTLRSTSMPTEGPRAAAASRFSSRSRTEPTNHVIGASKRFGGIVLEHFHDLTRMPLSDYDGTGGISLRDNLAGLNLTTVPKVLIECGNMRNSTDAALLVRPSFQRLAARALAAAISAYLLAPARRAGERPQRTVTATGAEAMPLATTSSLPAPAGVALGSVNSVEEAVPGATETELQLLVRA